MAYSVHIESDNGPIEASKWLAYVQEAPDFSTQESFTATGRNGEHMVTVELPKSGVWTNSSGGMVVFRFNEQGSIIVDAPSRETIKKMEEVAQEFDAKVVGDEGEEYVKGVIKDNKAEKTSWWESLKIYFKSLIGR